MLTFTKMNGAGNDFIMLDNREKQLCLDLKLINQLCDRHRGIGADGLIMVEPAESGGDFRMRYYNSDGNEAEMCGNGARCFARFADRVARLEGKPQRFETMAGMVSAELHGEETRLELSNPFDLVMSGLIDINNTPTTIHSINTGVPHAVVVDNDIEHLNVCEIGSAIRHHEHFQPCGTNVNFLSIIAPRKIAIRTYERGVEDETLACGTGMVASAIIHGRLTGAAAPIQVKVKGGDTLEVDWSVNCDDYTHVTLTGPAEFVFEGEINV
ncbi:MAG: diaminopimelate epimerase [Verrucomicrobiaceae bacterium]|nr:diaminopimelate epimerase [Verrucomicrobiaceae bacterium]